MVDTAIPEDVRAHDHALVLMREFDDENVDVVLASVALFLFHVYRAALEPVGVRFEDFAQEIGANLGRLASDVFASDARES